MATTPGARTTFCLLCTEYIEDSILGNHLEDTHGVVRVGSASIRNRRAPAVTREPSIYVTQEAPAQAATRVSAGSAYLCATCGHATAVIDSRKSTGEGRAHEYVIRRRSCLRCGERHTTYEMRLG